MKDPIVQLDAVIAPAELDLQVGDKLPIKINSKSIDTNYDLLQVTHTLDKNGLWSRCVLSDRKQIRSVMSFRDLAIYMANVNQRLEKVSAGRLFK